MAFRASGLVAVLVLGASLLAAPAQSRAEEGRYQTEVGPPVVVIDTETGAIWVGEQDPVQGLVLTPVRYEDGNGTLHERPPKE